MKSRNGIPIDIPSARKKVSIVKTKQPAEYNKYKTFATMFKNENGQKNMGYSTSCSSGF